MYIVYHTYLEVQLNKECLFGWSLYMIPYYLWAKFGLGENGLFREPFTGLIFQGLSLCTETMILTGRVVEVSWQDKVDGDPILDKLSGCSSFYTGSSVKHPKNPHRAPKHQTQPNHLDIFGHLLQFMAKLGLRCGDTNRFLWHINRISKYTVWLQHFIYHSWCLFRYGYHKWANYVSKTNIVCWQSFFWIFWPVMIGIYM